MKQMQIINNVKYFSLVLLTALFVFIPLKQTSATMLAVAEMNGGGGGGGGTTTGSTTTTSGSTISYGTISLTVTPNSDQPYTGSSPITLSSTASVAVCSNTELDLRVVAENVSPSGKTTNWGNLFDQHTAGGVQIIKNNTFTTSSEVGVNTVNLTATRYDPSGYSLEYEGGGVISGASYTEVKAFGTTYYVSTNYRGKIISVGSSYGSSDVPADLIKNASDDGSLSYGGSSARSNLLLDEPIKTYTTSFTYTVGQPTVQVTKNSVQAIPSGTKDTVSWTSTYANNCTCYISTNYIEANRCKDENGTVVPKGKTGNFKTETLTSNRTYYIKCDNL